MITQLESNKTSNETEGKNPLKSFRKGKVATRKIGTFSF
uniref:Uncharacterized protein n=1 Tax=Arundo donax TaxID=35708 RepID=A0A0A9DEL0_ARUDO